MSDHARLPVQNEGTRSDDDESFVLDDLWPVVYDELRRVARRQLRRERDGHTLNTTALVHEAYLKLARLDRLQWKNRVQFFAIAARAMRTILVDYAVRRRAQKRGGAAQQVLLDEAVLLTEARADAVLVLDEALKRLEKQEARWCQVIECRFFGGLSIKETADVLSISEATVVRDWTKARAWLNRELQAGSQGG